MTTKLRSVEELPTNVCLICNGDGYIVEHDPRDETGQTPMQVQCDFCHAEGRITTLDVVRTERATIAAVLIEGLEGKRWDDTCGICDGVAVNVHLRNGEDCPHCNGTGIDRGCYTHNQALDTAITLIRTTLNVTSEEK